MLNLKQKSKGVYGLWFIPLCMLILFIAIPLLLVLFSAGKGDFVSVATSEVWHQAMKNTFLECICSSTLSVLIGFLYAYAIVKSDIPFKNFFKLIPLIHLITPPFVGGLAFILLLGRQGFITHTLLGLDISLYGFWGLLIAQTLCFFPMAYLICLQTLQGINTNLEQAAKSMGAGKFKIFWTVTIPLSATGILSSLLFIAVSVLSDFGNPLIVGGRFRVLAVEIYTQLTGWLNVGTSAALGIVLVIPSVALFLLQNRLFRKTGNKLSTIGGKSVLKANSKQTESCSKTANLLLFLFVLLVTLIILAQFLSIIMGSFQKLWGIDTTFTMDHIKSVLKYTKDLGNSVSFALIAAVFSTIIAAISAFYVHRTNLPLRKTIDTLSQLPSAIPGSLLGLAISIAANRLHFRSSQILIIIAMTIAFLPFAYKVIASTYSQIRTTLDDGARSLGAGPLQVLKAILVPVSSGGIFSGFLYSFIRGVGTLSAVIFLVSFSTPLASVRILNLAEEGFWGKSAALALTLTIITFLILGLGVLILKLFSRGKKWKAL